MGRHDNCALGAHGIYALPADVCGWIAHQDAIDEHGFCPVCQHDHDGG